MTLCCMERWNNKACKWLNDHLSKPKARSKNNPAKLLERSFAYTEPVDHFVSKIKSLRGTKRSGNDVE